MKKDVLRHLQKTYGDLPLLWVSVLTKIVQTLLQRIFSVIVIARLASDIASGNIAGARDGVVLFVIVYALGSIIGAIGELMAIRATDGRYQELLIRYHQKLTGKDMAFYRNNQTGSLGIRLQTSFGWHYGTCAPIPGRCDKDVNIASCSSCSFDHY